MQEPLQYMRWTDWLAKMEKRTTQTYNTSQDPHHCCPWNPKWQLEIGNCSGKGDSRGEKEGWKYVPTVRDKVTSLTPLDAPAALASKLPRATCCCTRQEQSNINCKLILNDSNGIDNWQMVAKKQENVLQFRSSRPDRQSNFPLQRSSFSIHFPSSHWNSQLAQPLDPNWSANESQSEISLKPNVASSWDSVWFTFTHFRALITRISTIGVIVTLKDGADATAAIKALKLIRATFHPLTYDMQIDQLHPFSLRNPHTTKLELHFNHFCRNL